MSDDAERKKSPLVWVLGGCGGVIVLGACVMCVGPSIFGMAMMGVDGLGGSTPVTIPPSIGHTPPGRPAAAGEPGAGPILPPPAGPIAPPPGTIDPAQDLAPRRVRFTITTHTGRTDLAAGQECVAAIERRLGSGADYRCRADVSCGLVTLYGGLGRGFFPCQLLMNARRDVTGADDALTAADGDPAFRIDTTVNSISIQDATPTGEVLVIGVVTAIE